MRKNSLCILDEPSQYYRLFLEILIDSQIRYYASDVYKMLEFSTMDQFITTLEKAVNTLHLAEIPVEHHIRPVYISDKRDLIVDYKISPLAFGLITMYAETESPRIARIKVDWIRKILNEF